MAKKDERTPVIEYIWILKGTQVGNKQLKRGCYLAPGRIIQLDKKYKSVEKMPSGKPVDFKVDEAKAAKLIEENQAIACKRDNSGSPWYPVDIFGEKIPEDIKIVEVKPSSKKKDDGKKADDPS